MDLPALLLLLLVSLALITAAQKQCYWRSNDVTSVVTDWFACNNTQQIAGGAQLCCLGGSQCGENALCRQTSSGGGSGWFVGGCTDPTYQDPACRSSCTSDAQTWIQYNYTSQLWHCCGDDACTGTPTTETFQAAPPEQFVAVPSGPQSRSSSSAPTSAPTFSASPSPSPAGGLSSGAKAGIGVAAAVAGVAIAAAIAFLILWLKARKRRGQSTEATVQQEPVMQQQARPIHGDRSHQPVDYYYKPPEEMGTSQSHRPELAGDEAGVGSK